MWRVSLFLVALATVTAGDNSAIPPSILFKMRSVQSAEDFVRLFHRPPVPGEGGVPGEGDGIPPVRPEVPNGDKDENERDYPFDIIAKLPVCLPKPASVKIPGDADPYVYLWPPCVELHRCGGCCNNELFACEATATQNVDVKVYRTRYDPDRTDDLPIEQIDTFTLTNETECNCGCKVKPHHCNLAIHRHEYCQCVCIQKERDCPFRKVWDPRTCGCVCRKPLNERFCYSKNKVWRESSCQCECKKVENCRSDQAWHPAKCRCEGARRVDDYIRSMCDIICPSDQDPDSEQCLCKRLSRSQQFDEIQRQ